MIDYIKNMHFHNPWAGYLLIIPLLLLLWKIFLAEKFRHQVSISSLASMPSKFYSRKLFLKKNIFYLYLISIVLIILSIARPQGSAEGISIVLTLDISGSMGAQDLKPNRLGAALRVADDFIQSRPKDRIGLVVFKAEAFTQCPITTDHEALLEQLSKLQPNVLTDGTAIGLGLGTAVARLKESKSKSKVIILLTDGSNNAGFLDPETAADMAVKEHIRVYTISVGNKNYAMEMYNPLTGQNEIVKMDFDEALLKSIAKKTNAKFYNASDNNKLNEIFKDIDLLEKNLILDDKYAKQEELFYPFAMLAFFIFLVLIILENTYLKTID